MDDSGGYSNVIQTDLYVAPHVDHTALVSIDLQNDFCDLSVPKSIGSDSLTVANSVRLAAGFRSVGRLVVHVVRLYLQDGSNVDSIRRTAVRQGMQKVLVNTFGAEPVDGLLPSGSHLEVEQLLGGRPQQLGTNEFVIYKPRWGAFYQTALEEVLERNSVDTLVICGTVFPNCVRATIHQALERDYRVVLAYDAIAGIYARGVREYIGMGGNVLSTDRVLELFCSPEQLETVLTNSEPKASSAIIIKTGVGKCLRISTI